tara:strand:- start:1059 stop:1307 length:249 start_codon:yes stop_codon:yes gene_type:complete
MDINKNNADLITKIESISQLRKSISLELKTIANKTKISTNTLKNIESLKFDKLPPHPMKESFINQYFHEVERSNKHKRTTKI